MPKWAKQVLAILLLPACVGLGEAVLRLLRASGGADTVWVPLIAGAACWLVVYLLLPRPMWLYVAGHELTHALWTWLFAGRVKRIKVRATGGHVIVTRTNFLITLAPYFFPFYAALVIAGFALGHVVWGWRAYLPWFHLVLGAAYAFHVTLTVQVLQTRQSDITDQGYLFSAVVIWLGNLGLLLLGVPLMTAQVGLGTALGWWLDATGRVLTRLVGGAGFG
jgi:hypothetical protein